MYPAPYGHHQNPRRIWPWVVGGVVVVGGLVTFAAYRRRQIAVTPAPTPTPEPEEKEDAVAGGIPWFFKTEPVEGGYVAWIQSPRGATTQLPDVYLTQEEARAAAQEKILGYGAFPVPEWPGEQTPLTPVLEPGTHHLYLGRFYYVRLPREARFARSSSPDRRGAVLIHTFNQADPGRTGVRVYAAPKQGDANLDVTYYDHDLTPMATYHFIVSSKPWYA